MQPWNRPKRVMWFIWRIDDLSYSGQDCLLFEHYFEQCGLLEHQWITF